MHIFSMGDGDSNHYSYEHDKYLSIKLNMIKKDKSGMEN